MQTGSIILILVIAITLLIGCFCYLYIAKKRSKKYEEELIKEIKFENKLKKEAEKKEEPEKNKDEVFDLEAMLNQMQEDLEAQNKDKTVNFEQEQEETSIISYQELKKANRELTEEEELAQEQSPISLKEILSIREEERERLEDPILSMIEETKMPIATTDVSPKKVHPVLQEEKKKFQNTEFISPIYGKQEQKVEYPHIPVYENQEEVLSVLEEEPKISHNEMQENETFLNELKNFRNQL